MNLRVGSGAYEEVGLTGFSVHIHDTPNFYMAQMVLAWVSEGYIGSKQDKMNYDTDGHTSQELIIRQRS